MSVAEQTPVAGYTGNGITTAFSFPFSVLAEGDVSVMVAGLLLTLNVHYTVSGVGGASGTVTFTSAPASLASIVIYRESELTRATDYQDNGDLLAATLNRDLDRLWLALQEVLAGSKVSPRSVRAPIGETLSDLPAAAARAGRLLSFNAVTGDVDTVAPVEGTATALATQLASPATGDGASMVFLEGGGTVQDLVERFAVPVLGVGDGVADDTAVIVAALARVASGGVAMCRPGKTYRITSGIAIANNYQVLDLNGSSILADFASGTAVTVGNGVSTVSALGIRNGVIKTTNPSTSLNGVIFKKNVRRRVEYGGLWISSFKGVGLQFEELNWSIQAKDAPLIENCGVNLDINDNGNAITIAGIGLDGASSYNARLRGTVAVTFVGGYNQNAGTAGILLDTGTLGALQQSLSTSLFGVYLEANGTSHIIGNGGKGLTVKGCFINCNTMSGQAIDLNSWTGADIAGNTPQNTGGRDFVNADASSALIRIGRQNITTMSDAVIGGSPNAYVSDGFPAPVATLPTASLVNRGTTMLLAETGTAIDSSRPYMCMDLAASSRGFRQIELRPRKQGATAGGTTLTPDFGALEIYDLTLLAAGITVNAPTGPFKDGDEITFIFKQSAVPTGAVVWNAVYKTDMSATLLAAAYGSVVFRYSGGRSLWVQVAKMEWKV